MSLNNVKDGDWLATGNDRHGRYEPDLFMSKVERQTKTMIVLEFGAKVRKDTGAMVGDKYTTFFVPTDAQIKLHKEQEADKRRFYKALEWFHALSPRTMRLEQLEAMRTAYKTTTRNKP